MTVLNARPDGHSIPVVFVLEGNGSRPSHRGGGLPRITTDVHAEHYRSSCGVLQENY